MTLLLAQVTPHHAVGADERPPRRGTRRDQPRRVLERDGRRGARRREAHGDHEVGAARHPHRGGEIHGVVTADGGRAGAGHGGRRDLVERRRDPDLVGRARRGGVEAHGGDAAVAAARVPGREPRRLVLVPDALGPAERVVLVDGVVVGRPLHAVEDSQLRAERAVVIRDPEVAAEAELRPPAVLDEEGAGARRPAHEPRGRIGIVPAHDADMMVELGVARVVRARRPVQVVPHVGHHRVHGAVFHHGPLDRRVRPRALARREEQHLLDVTHGAQPLTGRPGTRIPVVTLQHGAGPTGHVGSGDRARGAPFEAQARALEVGHVVLGEVETRAGQQARLERAEGGEDPARAVVGLLADAGHPAQRAQVILLGERAPRPRRRAGGRRRDDAQRRYEERRQERRPIPLASAPSPGHACNPTRRPRGDASDLFRDRLAVAEPAPARPPARGTLRRRAARSR